MEDLWLCYAAASAGYDLFKSPAEFASAEDEHDLYASLGHTKWRFLRYLIRQGWDPIDRDGGAGQRAATTSTQIETPGSYRNTDDLAY